MSRPDPNLPSSTTATPSTTSQSPRSTCSSGTNPTRDSQPTASPSLTPSAASRSTSPSTGRSSLEDSSEDDLFDERDRFADDTNRVSYAVDNIMRSSGYETRRKAAIVDCSRIISSRFSQGLRPHARLMDARVNDVFDVVGTFLVFSTASFTEATRALKTIEGVAESYVFVVNRGSERTGGGMVRMRVQADVPPLVGSHLIVDGRSVGTLRYPTYAKPIKNGVTNSVAVSNIVPAVWNSATLMSIFHAGWNLHESSYFKQNGTLNLVFDRHEMATAYLDVMDGLVIQGVPISVSYR